MKVVLTFYPPLIHGAMSISTKEVLDLQELLEEGSVNPYDIQGLGVHVVERVYP